MSETFTRCVRGMWENESGPGGAGNTNRSLTHPPASTGKGLAVKATRACSIEGCQKAAVTRGWCGRHYSRWRRTGDPGPADPLLRRGDTQCRVGECARPGPFVQGLCQKHYASFDRYGDPLQSADYRPRNQQCEAPDCTLKAKTDGLCPMHIWRVQRYGTLDLPPRNRHMSSHGYVIVRAIGHPLATRHGWVYEHRKVLFDSIGPGTHSCQWCGAPVTWGSPDRDYWIEADHIDWDKQNNEPANIVPSCHACNSGRLQRGETA